MNAILTSTVTSTLGLLGSASQEVMMNQNEAVLYGQVCSGTDLHSSESVVILEDQVRRVEQHHLHLFAGI